MVQVSQKQLISLVEQGLRGSTQGFALITRKIISELKRSDPDTASLLSNFLINESGTRAAEMRPAPVDGDSRRSLLREVKAVVLEDEPLWEPKVQASLHRILRERQEVTRLIAGGLEPIRAALFKGPPGVGKTLATFWLGRELGVPVLTLDLASVMSSLLGKTGSNIKSVIDYARSFPCILLLDEFDAIAKKRDDDRDVGELKRLVNVLLQSIDEWPSSSLLIAATNHPEMLDPAVWRRFDLTVDFGEPSFEMLVKMLCQNGVEPAAADRLATSLKGLSFADVKRIILSAKKSVILEGKGLEESLLVCAGVSLGCEEDRNIRIAELAREGYSQRKIADLVGVSHPTVGRVLKSQTLGGK